MKIAVLTLPLKTNYGGLLQAYALQQVLLRLGHEAIVLDRRKRALTVLRKILAVFRNVFRRVRGQQLLFFPTEQEEAIVSQHTARFINQYIRKTEVIRSSRALVRVFKNEGFDAIIVGSDQVWRPRFSNVGNCFLDFLDNDNMIRKVAYAASFGVDHWEFSSRMTRRCRRLIKGFDAVSVREDSGIMLCKNYLQSDAQLVLDPTLLLDGEDYCLLAESNNNLSSTGGLVSYILDSSAANKAIIEKVATITNLTHFSNSPGLKLTNESRNNIESCIARPVSQWLQRILNAEFIITDSFHGCVFSIMFNKPFIAIGNRGRGLSRFESLLDMFNLCDRLIFSLSDLSEKLLLSEMDWESVNKILNQKKRESLLYLIRAFN